MKTTSNFKTSTVSWLDNQKLNNRTLSSGLHIILIISAVAFIYYRSLEGEFLNIDDVKNLSSVFDRPPRVSFIDHSYIWFSTSFYRPLFLVQTWSFYQLFGLNFAPMQACILGMHALTSVVVYLAIKKMSGSREAGFFTALIYASSFVIGLLVTNFITDTAPLTNLLFAITLLLLAEPSDKTWWYLALFGCLLVAPITRENGLVLIGGVGLFTLYNGYWGDYNYNRVRGILLTCISTFVLYVLIRTNAVGLPSATLTESGPSPVAISQIILSNFVAVFAPLIQAADLGYGLLNVIFGVTHSLLSILVIIGLISGWGTMSHKDRGIIFLGIILIVCGSIIPFIYFRYRNLNIPYFGWLILFAMFFAHQLPNVRYKVTRWIVISTVFSLIIFSSLMITLRLPNGAFSPTLENAQILCHEDVSEDLAIEISNWNGFEIQPILDCRE